jgi:hypothetical protein
MATVDEVGISLEYMLTKLEPASSALVPTLKQAQNRKVTRPSDSLVSLVRITKYVNIGNRAVL